jgi:CBS domain containing-hemolysin-like protein
MRQDNADMAILVDEVGHATGHVTLHDVLDAWLAPTPDVTREDLDLTNLAGTTPIKDVFHLLGRSLQDIQDLDVQTIGGWVLKHIGRMPARGETLQQDGLEIYVMDTSPRHIKRLKITPCSGPLNKEHSQ